MRLVRLGSAESKPRIQLGAPAPMAQPASCDEDAGGHDCRRAVLQADRHLRDVYQKAIQRGVSRRVLVDYRGRWADLRERNKFDPTSLIESYGALASDLGRENGQDAAQRPKGHSGLRALANLLLPRR
jgi:hypothetical protein